MSQFLSIVKGDVKQRTRSYAFLIIMAISLYVGFTFVPAPDASYATVQVGKYIGEYNSAWIGHVTALMASLFVVLIGFYLVNNSIKKDIETEVGMIIATTRITNFQYLFSKAISNFLVLMMVVGMVFVMGIFIFFFRSDGYTFELIPFLIPFLLIPLPAVFFVACLAVLAEVFLRRWPVVQYIGFFVLFNVTMANVQTSKNEDLIMYFDPLGLKAVSIPMSQTVREKYDQAAQFNMGFNFSPRNEKRTFLFDGVSWSLPFIASRGLWMAFGVALVFGASVFFHRFDVHEVTKSRKKNRTPDRLTEHFVTGERKLAGLTPVVADYSILPFIKTELLMLVRKGSRWLWLLNAGVLIAIVFSPIAVAHRILLPILWFMQIHRISDLVTKEQSHRVHYFAFSAYQPLKRLLPSQIIAGVILMIIFSIPLLVRYAVSLSWLPIMGIIMGGIFIVLFSVFLGMISKGKKLFEVLFFLLTYANLNNIPGVDYFGSQWTTNQPIIVLTLLIIFFGFVSGLVRRYDIAHL